MGEKVITNEAAALRQVMLKRMELAFKILNSLTDEEIESIVNGKGTLYYESLQP